MLLTNNCLKKYIYLFNYFWLHWVLVAAGGLSPVAMSGGHPSSRCAGPLTGGAPSRCGVWAPERSLSSCGKRAQLLYGTWDPPGPGPEPASPALAGRFPTIVPPRKPQMIF